MAQRGSPRKNIAAGVKAESEFEGPLRKWLNNNLVSSVLSGLILAGLGFLYHQNGRLNEIDVELGKIKQRIADGGTHEIVSQIEGATDPSSIAPTMALITAQVRLDQFTGKKPDAGKIERIAPAVVDAAKRFPSATSTWEAAASLASYRTAAVELPLSPSLPDCNAKSKQAQIMYPEDYPNLPMASRGHGNEVAYLFENCVLHLDQLPGKRSEFHISKGALESSPDTEGAFLIGYHAYAHNALVVLGSAGVSDTDIVELHTTNCRFQFQVNTLPNGSARDLLIAALQSPVPGTLTTKLS